MLHIEIKRNKNYETNIAKLQTLTDNMEIRIYPLSAYLYSNVLEGYVVRHYTTNKLMLRVGLASDKKYDIEISMSDIMAIFSL